MAQLFDARGNELKGFPDAVTNDVVTESRVLAASLGALAAEAVVDLSGQQTLAIDIRGTFVGTFVIEGTVDGTNYLSIPVLNQATQAFIASTTAAGVFLAQCAGYKRVRVRCTAYTSGAAIVSMRASQGGQLILSQIVPATLAITATAAAGSPVTLTLPAVTGLYHYLSHLRIQRFAAALLTAAAAPVVVTTTNLPGSLAFSIPAEAAAQGTIYDHVIEPTEPLKSSAPGTNTTVVCPTTTGVIWRATALYRVGQ